MSSVTRDELTDVRIATNLTYVRFRYRSALRPLTHKGDVGGQKTLRSYWRNYFEKTDALIWVVDATDRLRIDDCREELHGLLQEEGCVLQKSRSTFTGMLTLHYRGFLVPVFLYSPIRLMSMDVWMKVRFNK